MLKENHIEPSKAPSAGMNTAKARKMDNLLSVAFSSGKVELPIAYVSSLKKQHLAGSHPIPWHTPVKLRYVHTTLLLRIANSVRHSQDCFACSHVLLVAWCLRAKAKLVPAASTMLAVI
jgi:hypothetical protein